MYDFDWDGSTLAIGDAEAQTFVLPEDPGGNQGTSVESPGLLPPSVDLVNFGVYNGNFRLGPPDPSNYINTASSTAASNFVRGWRFVVSSNATNMALRMARDTTSPGGSNLQFVFGSGLANDTAYIEQIIDIGGISFGQTGDLLYVAGKLTAGSGFAIRARTQYLDTDGRIAGMPAERVHSAVAGAGSLTRVMEETSSSAPPGNARFLRIRIEAYRTSGTAGGWYDLVDVRRMRGAQALPLVDYGGSSSGSISYLRSTSTGAHAGVWQRSAASGVGGMPLGWKLVPIPFAFVDMPAGATTELRPVDGAVGIGTVPRLKMPWAGHVVGMTARLTDAPTAGTYTLRATVNGTAVWSPFGALGVGSAPSQATTQALGTDTFAAGDELGVDCVTTAGYLPTTRDFAVLLWLAIEYDGS